MSDAGTYGDVNTFVTVLAGCQMYRLANSEQLRSDWNAK